MVIGAGATGQNEGEEEFTLGGAGAAVGEEAGQLRSPEGRAGVEGAIEQASVDQAASDKVCKSAGWRFGKQNSAGLSGARRWLGEMQLMCSKLAA